MLSRCLLLDHKFYLQSCLCLSTRVHFFHVPNSYCGESCRLIHKYEIQSDHIHYMGKKDFPDKDKLL